MKDQHGTITSSPKKNLAILTFREIIRLKVLLFGNCTLSNWQGTRSTCGIAESLLFNNGELGIDEASRLPLLLVSQLFGSNQLALEERRNLTSTKNKQD